MISRLPEKRQTTADRYRLSKLTILPDNQNTTNISTKQPMNKLTMKNRALTNLILTGIIVILSAISVNAQEKDPVILTVAGEEITKSEFLNVYHKNNVNGEVLDRKSLEDYMELYINFRLKVKEAESLGMDTMASFREELGGYRKQLAQPYLIDEKMNKALLEEAYNRKKEDIRASHILVRIDRNSAPEDTLTAYKKIMAIRKRALKGEDFNKLARENSDDPSAKDRSTQNGVVKGNNGDLGYFTVFDMVYPFETGAYNTKVGEISMPVRSDFGYHLIKVTDRKPAMGRAQVAHILIRIPAKATAADSAAFKEKALEAYNRIMKGEDFAKVVEEYSDDKTTSTKGGVLPWFTSNKMIPEFIYEVSKLKNLNEVTKPFSSTFGWHIIKLIDRKEIGSFEDNLNDLKQNLTRSDRAEKSEDALIRKIKAEYNFTQNLKARKDLYKVVTDSVFKGKWSADAANALDKTLFTINNKAYTQKDFANWLAKNQKPSNKERIQSYVDKMITEYTNQELLAYEDSQLERKYPEFKLLMKEYRDGILLFELTEQKIWSKASKDTLGLENFFMSNRNNYMWGQHIDATIYTLNTKDNQVIENFKAQLKNNVLDQDLLTLFNKDNKNILSIESRKFEKGDIPENHKLNWEKGAISQASYDGKTEFMKVNSINEPQLKKLNEVKGLVTANYQDHLEQEWIKELRSKYSFKVNQSVLSSIK